MADIPYSWLVVSTILKNMKVSWDYCSQYLEKIKIKKKVPGRYTYRYRYIWLFCGYIWLVWVYLAIPIPTIVYGRYTYSNLMAGRSIIGIGIYRITYKWPI